MALQLPVESTDMILGASVDKGHLYFADDDALDAHSV
jgi:hypothetical protein